MNILLISYNYFPYNTPAVYRVHSFAKALVNDGHQVHILSSKTHRAPIDLQTVKKFQLDVRSTVTCCMELTRPVDCGQAASLWQKIKNKIGSIIESKFLPFDASFLWFFVAFVKARKIIRDESITTLVVSSPPHSTQVLGLVLKKIYRLNLVSDFRDAWVHNPVHNSVDSSPSLVARLGEAQVLKNASVVVANTPANKRLLEKDYQIDNEKINIILNGYVSADVPSNAAVAAVNKKDKFRLVYTGELYPGYAEKIFNAIKLLKDKHPDLSSKFVFEMAGMLVPEDLEQVKTLDISDVFLFHGFVSYQKCIELVQGASIVLLVLPKTYTNVIGSKLYFYLGQRKNVLALIPEGDAANVIKSVNAGNVVNPDDVDGICALLESWLNGEQSIDVNYNDSEWKKLSREHQAEKVVKIMKMAFS